MKTSCINHPPNEALVVIRQWQVELCEGNTTAAALLSFFEYWHNIKLEMHSRASRSNDIAEMHGDERTQDESLLQFHTEEELIAGIMIAKRDTIRKALSYLSDSGFVSIHSNPNPKYAFDRTRYFQFHPEPVNQWLSEKRPLSKVLPTMSKIRHGKASSKNQRRQLKNQSQSSENQSAITEITPEITPETTLPPNPENGEKKESGSKSKKREEGTNPRATGTNPRANGTNPRALGTNPRAEDLNKPSAVNSVEQTAVTHEDKGSAVAVATINTSTSLGVEAERSRSFNYKAAGMQDPNDRKTRQQREFNWVADGPWKVNGKLDNNFVDWKTAKWVKDYGRDIHTTRGNVLQHFKKDAANLAIAWDEYHREHLHRFSNAAVRERSGWSLTSSEQQALLQHEVAVTQPVPEEIASTNYSLPAAVKEFTPDIADRMINPTPSLPSLPEGFEGRDVPWHVSTYQEWKPSVQLSEEERAANVLKLKEMMRGVRGGVKAATPPPPPEPTTVFEKLQRDLEDPAIRFDPSVQAQAQRFVGEHEEYTVDYNDEGLITAIYQF